MSYKYITTEAIDDGSIMRILLNRPGARNAQNRGLLVELDEAFTTIESDDQVRVVILGGVGPAFSSGHDLGSADAVAEQTVGPELHPSYQGFGANRQGVEKRALQEWHFYFQNTLRWRNIRKITIAQVQGKCFAGGLMLAWACDLITAAENAEFADVVGSRLGMCGLEYFGHPWEFGPRKAKELLLTGDSIGAVEAHRLGMVSKVFSAERLSDDTLAFARRIARLPSVTSLLIKESVNQTVDNQGFYNSLQACFSIHQMNHAHWADVTGGQAAAGPDQGVARNAPVLPALMGSPGGG